MSDLPWHERWRNRIRLGETGITIGLWAGGLAASDMVIASLLLLGGLAIGIVALLADPTRSRTAKAIVGVLFVLLFGATEGVVYWRHKADAPKAHFNSVGTKSPATQITVEGPGATGSQSANTINNYNAPTNQTIESAPTDESRSSR